MLRNSTQHVCLSGSAKLAAALLACIAVPAHAAPAPVITVRMLTDAGVVSGEMLRSAGQEAQQIYREAGIETDWLLCAPSREDPGQDAGCHQPHNPGDLNLRIVPPSMEKRLPAPDSTFGLAIFDQDGRPTTNAYVFYGRVEERAKKAPCTAAQLLGHVMAHEAGHLLLGRRHAPCGLMSAQWDRKALGEAARGWLLFGRDEAERLQAGVRSRMATAEGALHATAK
jgi:hypothetical protein